MAGGSDASLGWSDLTIDLLIDVLGLLDLPEALAFREVCSSWRSASKAAGASRSHRTPWLVSLAIPARPTSYRSSRPRDPATAVSSVFRNLVDGKTYQVGFPRGKGKAVALCGASHGWLVVANELSDLVLYDPFTTALVTLPPITSFRGMHLFDKPLSKNLFDKVVLSGSPSTGGDAIAFLIGADGKQLSYTMMGETSWWPVSTIQASSDSIADCVYHTGRFYALTMKGRLTSWDFTGLRIPKREEIISNADYFIDVFTRYLVSTPWGHLLSISLQNNVRVEIDMLDPNNRKMVRISPVNALRGHAVFLGQNSPGNLSVAEFPELNLRPDCIYFTTPRPRNAMNFWGSYNKWSGVKIYDLKKQTLEDAFPSGCGNYGTIKPSEIWLVPSPIQAEPVATENIRCLSV